MLAEACHFNSLSSLGLGADTFIFGSKKVQSAWC
jgi:hypothetical protein